MQDIITIRGDYSGEVCKFAPNAFAGTIGNHVTLNLPDREPATARVLNVVVSPDGDTVEFTLESEALGEVLISVGVNDA